MPKFIDLTGQRFGRLIAIELDKENSKHGYNKWICKCDCGNNVSVWVGSLRRKDGTKSCGCFHRQRTSEASIKHGMGYETRLYRIWHGIKFRCYNSHYYNYSNYGGRGISMCDEWKESFVEFYNWAVHNGYDDSLTIDRIDNNGNYCPENCRWADRKTQARNSRHAHNITIDGDTKCVKAWIDELNIDESIARSWLSKGEEYFIMYFKIVKCLQEFTKTAGE